MSDKKRGQMNSCAQSQTYKHSRTHTRAAAAATTSINFSFANFVCRLLLAIGQNSIGKHLYGIRTKCKLAHKAHHIPFPHTRAHNFQPNGDMLFSNIHIHTCTCTYTRDSEFVFARGLL